MIDIATLLLAIAMVESNCTDNAVGKKHGERGRYQIRESTWYEHTDMNFRKHAKHPECSTRVALARLNFIRAHLPNEYKNDVRSIATCWNRGLSGWVKVRNKKPTSYAERVHLTYNALKRTKQNGALTHFFLQANPELSHKWTGAMN